MATCRRLTAYLVVLGLVVCRPAVSDDLKLAWMLGCWTGVANGYTTEERWTSHDGTMIGVSESLTSSGRVQLERLVIERDSDGIVTLTASPRGQDTARFFMVRIEDTEVVFENREHDFPQRIIYRLLSTTRLLGRIEGVRNGKADAVNFPMQRTDCENE